MLDEFADPDGLDFPAAVKAPQGRPRKLDAQKSHTKRSGPKARDAKVLANKNTQVKGSMRGRRLTDDDKETIVQVFGSTGGHAAKTAASLGLTTDTVYRVLRERKAQAKGGRLEFSGVVAGELQAALTAKSRLIIDTFTAEDLADMSASQRAITVGIFTDKAIKLMELEQREKEFDAGMAMPSAQDAQGLLARIAQQVQSMPFLQVTMAGKGLLGRAAELAQAIPAPVAASPVLDMDGNNVGTFLAPGKAEADTWAEQEASDAPGDRPVS